MHSSKPYPKPVNVVPEKVKPIQERIDIAQWIVKTRTIIPNLPEGKYRDDITSELDAILNPDIALRNARARLIAIQPRLDILKTYLNKAQMSQTYKTKDLIEDLPKLVTPIEEVINLITALKLLPYLNE